MLSETVALPTAAAPVSFNDTEMAFASKSDAELRKASFLFSLMGNRVMLWVGLKTIPLGIRLRLPFVKMIVKNTIFGQFVGGERLADTDRVVEKLASYNVKSILDYGVEGKEGNASLYDKAEQQFLEVINHSARQPHIPFISIKMTGVMSSRLLEAIHSKMANDGEGLMQRYQKALAALDENTRNEWEAGLNRVRRICSRGKEANVGIWLDAEESWMQDPMDAASFLMMESFNREKPLVYNTYQLYRHDRLEFLKESHRYAAAQDFILGAKLVRGAYMEKERKRAEEKKYDSPIQPDKASTDRDYDSAIEYCVEHISRIAIVLGSHNEKSSLLAARLLLEKGFRADHPHIHFSQLLGMSDNITFILAASGFVVSKYVPFGPIQDVVPYLMRRAEENSSVKGQTGRELSLIRQELRRRKLT